MTARNRLLEDQAALKKTAALANYPTKMMWSQGMKKLLTIAAVLVLSGALAATAAASLRTYIAGTKYVKAVGTVGSFRATVKQPYKIILYCEGANALCGANVVCVRGASTFAWNRTGLTPGTWNLKKKTWFRMASCHFKATIRSGFNDARVTVQASVRF